MTARHSVFWLTLDASEITGVEITSTLPARSLVFAVYPKFSVGAQDPRGAPPRRTIPSGRLIELLWRCNNARCSTYDPLLLSIIKSLHLVNCSIIFAHSVVFANEAAPLGGPDNGHASGVLVTCLLAPLASSRPLPPTLLLSRPLCLPPTSLGSGRRPGEDTRPRRQGESVLVTRLSLPRPFSPLLAPLTPIPLVDRPGRRGKARQRHWAEGTGREAPC